MQGRHSDKKRKKLNNAAQSRVATAALFPEISANIDAVTADMPVESFGRVTLSNVKGAIRLVVSTLQRLKNGLVGRVPAGANTALVFVPNF